MKTFYTNALIYRQGGFAPGCLVVDEGRFVEADAPAEGDRVVDLQGMPIAIYTARFTIRPSWRT